MTFLMVLVATIVAVLALRQPLHKWPVAFYALAVAADVAYIAGIEGLLPRAVTSPLTLDEFGELGRILHASYGNAH